MKPNHVTRSNFQDAIDRNRSARSRLLTAIARAAATLLQAGDDKPKLGDQNKAGLSDCA